MHFLSRATVPDQYFNVPKLKSPNLSYAYSQDMDSSQMHSWFFSQCICNRLCPPSALISHSISERIHPSNESQDNRGNFNTSEQNQRQQEMVNESALKRFSKFVPPSARRRVFSNSVFFYFFPVFTLFFEVGLNCVAVQRMNDWMTERLSVRLQRELELAGFQLAKVQYAYEAGSAQIEVGEMGKKNVRQTERKKELSTAAMGSLKRHLISCLCLFLLSG